MTSLTSQLEASAMGVCAAAGLSADRSVGGLDTVNTYRAVPVADDSDDDKKMATSLPIGVPDLTDSASKEN